MATVNFKDKEVKISGKFPEIGSKAPDFKLTKGDLSDVSLKDFAGKTIVMNIFPSIDTPVCALSVRKFNEESVKLENCVVLCISADLPFAQGRFCAAEGIKNVVVLSELRDREFGASYGVRILEGPLAGLLARGVVVIDENGKVIYTQLVPEITHEPDYEKVFSALRK